MLRPENGVSAASEFLKRC